MIIVAKFDSRCPACGGFIDAGTKVEWEKGAKAKHVKCATSSAAATAPKRAAVPSVADAPYVRQEKWEPCKRAALPDTTGDVRVVGAFKRSWASLRDGASGEPVVEGDAMMVVAQTAVYESAEDNEDMGDMSGPGWHVTFYLRRATAEEAAPALEKAAKAKAAREEREAAQAAEREAIRARTDTYNMTLETVTKGLVRTNVTPKPFPACTLLVEDPDGYFRRRLSSTADGGYYETAFGVDDDRAYYYATSERVRELVLAWAAEHKITAEKAREWLEKYRGCEGTGDYEIVAASEVAS